jgi:hypothetical protein
MKRYCKTTGKRSLSKAHALRVHAATGQRADVNVYRCRACGYWHLGHSRSGWRLQARLDQLFARIREPARPPGRL